MKTYIWTALALAAALLSTGSVSAHDGDHPPDMRVWRDTDGLFEIEGSFVLARDGRVQILKHGGSVVWVPLDKLSEADRAWVRDRVEVIRRINGASPDSRPDTPSPASSAVGAGGSADPTWEVVAVFVAVIVAAAARKAVGNKRSGVVATVLVITGAAGVLATAQDGKPKSAIQTHFEPFKDKLKFRSDDKWFYVESNGMPDHPMMVGITAWQQQLPIPQAYTGRNAWQIPLFPKLSDKPVSAKKELFRGAIALAANGVPIFNPIKNDGRTDTFLAGELDEYGGHCGRADDYHYHTAPVHLEKVVGKGNPIGYALDGFPLYGFTDADGKEPTDLDEFNGRTEKDGYRYYSTKKYPYVNGGLRGVVTVKDDQIDPQPRAYSPRPALTPLRGAKITGFERDDDKKTVTVKYEQGGKVGSVKYTAAADSYQFEFTEPGGKTTTETYKVREDGKRPPPKKDGPPKKEDRPPPPKKDGQPPKAKDGFTLSSPAFEQNGKMPAEFTGDGDGVSPPLKWSGAPDGTKYYALQLWHKPKANGNEVKSYWVVTNIPATVTGLEKNSKGVGKDGINDKKRTGYDPMNSKGPGAKEYHVTLYALSAEPKFDTDKVTRADLLKAIKDITLAETTLSYTYERKAK
ncbi:YHYH protein [Tuwongella immobilis]|uniref:YHYH domain-containing protein n=1 Tax=Tuwongella immobilis TaxID=692036 RepID=A0A6C2YR87_9BACT|nr:YHYH protein [Tuwongella immobilis]VIP03996.1 phospholipid-binding protein : Phospholipid-binding protein OS=Rhodopirellula baltica SWK14 GN=RBSWK_06035 PE=4 SV=1: SHD1: YHYH: PBP [Tuwongella immobilis]VTS05359.1 phospholipid-binding protein : Phospholipid-binding protein OS=Rhodopirellula baltica SWK14 GN=RBSWK_06035 PE=4 SV=1: SHD1: YHYH: PBP [Tuwongella immobilis]